RLYGTSDRVELGRQVVSAADFTCDLFSNRLMYQGYVWNKLFRRELIEKDDPVHFRRGIAFNEDRLFVYEYLKRCESVAVAGEACYGYRLSASRKGYAPSQATEIAAFDRMATDLHRRIDAGEPLDGALHYLEKDTFRAAVELFIAADASGDPDAIWLIERVRELDGHAGEFSDYPAEFIEKIGWAVARASLQTA
ncbi:MAG: hypothetical protein Q4D39_03510, partial [Coriobacteriaceae bacterium]|nr:hypothetical protein [Coriobacteriaceae bacterium]